MDGFKKALEDFVKFAKDNPAKIEEFLARDEEINKQMKQDFEAIKKGGV
jgi:hypothetical protein